MSLRGKAIKLALHNPTLQAPLLGILKVGASLPAHFWPRIKGMRWPRRSPDELKTAVMFTYQRKGAAWLIAMVHVGMENLRVALEDAGLKTGLPWKREQALFSHIVGLGKDEWDASLKDPQRIVERAHRGKFSDFTEAFPSRDDFKDLVNNKFKTIARKQTLSYLEAADDPAFGKLKKEIDYLVRAYDYVLKDNIPAFMYTGLTFEQYTRKIAKTAAQLGLFEPNNPVYDQSIAMKFFGDLKKYSGYDQKRVRL